MFIFIVCLLFCIAFLLSLRALRAELKKSIKTHEVAASLAKGRVLFIAESSAKKKEEEHTIHQVTPEIQVSHQPETQPIEPIHSLPQHPQEQTLSDVRHQLSQFDTNQHEDGGKTGEH